MDVATSAGTLDIAARAGGGILHNAEHQLAGGIRDECIAATAVTGNAGAGHRLFATQVEVNGQLPRSGPGIEVEELRETYLPSGSRTEFDGIDQK